MYITIKIRSMYMFCQYITPQHHSLRYLSKTYVLCFIRIMMVQRKSTTLFDQFKSYTRTLIQDEFIYSCHFWNYAPRLRNASLLYT